MLLLDIIIVSHFKEVMGKIFCAKNGGHPNQPKLVPNFFILFFFFNLLYLLVYWQFFLNNVSWTAQNEMVGRKGRMSRGPWVGQLCMS